MAVRDNSYIRELIRVKYEDYGYGYHHIRNPLITVNAASVYLTVIHDQYPREGR